jgi:glycosyltransferase involved in cell wall biosynthesis
MASVQKHASTARRKLPLKPYRDRETATGTVLCLANYAANTGYAWDYIESLFARVADRVAPRGVTTFVAYPAIDSPPRPLRGSAAKWVVLDTSLETARSRRAVCEFIRREQVRVIYLVDRSVWSWAYPQLKWAGARRLIVYDHTSGERERPGHVRRLAKWLLLRVPGLRGDIVAAVSEYVARRHREVGQVPRRRVVRVYNGIEVPADAPAHGRDVLARLGLPGGRPVIVCACRATVEKGVAHLLRAFERVAADPRPPEQRPILLYLGGGPHFDSLMELRNSLRARDDVILAGPRQDAKDFIAAGDICVVPSIWQEACPLGVLEPMAYGKPVVGTKVGGIPELIEDAVTGLLVAPGDEVALADALRALLADPQRAARMGVEGRARVVREFNPRLQESQLVALVEEGLGIAPEEA